MNDKILAVIGEFKFDEFLKEINDATIKQIKESKAELEEPLLTELAAHISLSASYVMIHQYSALRVEGKSICDSLISAQNNYIAFAYEIATGKILGVGNIGTNFQDSFDALRFGFGIFQRHAGGDSKKYALFLGEVTYNSLREIHPACKDLDKNIGAVKERYSPPHMSGKDNIGTSAL